MSYLGDRLVIPFAASEAARREARISAAPLVWGTAAAAGLAGLVVGLLAKPPYMDAELVPLLRFMALIKAGMALGAAALTQWRLRREAGVWVAGALVGSTALMMGAPGLIWALTHVVLGAVLFHAGLVVFLVAAARDGFGVKAGRVWGG